MGVGYVGTRLVLGLKSRGYELVLTTTTASKVERLKEFTDEVLLIQPTVECDLLKKAIHESDGMIILISPKEGRGYEETYLHTAQLVMSYVKERKAPFYLLYTSSTSVYEGIDDEWATEDMKLHPLSPHSRILLETENEYVTHPTSCILRLGGIYGPGRTLEDRARKMSGTKLPRSGDEPTNHIHVDDIVSAIQFCLNRRLTGIYNLTNDDHQSRKVLYGEICQSLGILFPQWSDGAQGKLHRGYKVSSLKIQSEGYIFKHPRLILHELANKI